MISSVYYFLHLINNLPTVWDNFNFSPQKKVNTFLSAFILVCISCQSISFFKIRMLTCKIPRMTMSFCIRRKKKKHENSKNRLMEKKEVADQAKHAHMVPESKIKHSMCGWHTNKVIHVTKNEHIYIHPHAFRAYMQACNCAGLSQCTSPSWTHLLLLLSLLVLSSIKRVYAEHVQWLSILLISHSCFFVFHFVWFFTLCSRFACDSRNKRSNTIHFILCQLY